jgi:hypothetical protein
VHDHPWPFFTLILKGGYWEWRPQFDAKGQKAGEIAKWCGPGSFRWAKANQYHRVELDPDVNVGPCSALDPNNVIGDFWFRTDGYNGNSI